MSNDIVTNLEHVRQRIAAACRRANRSPEEITLVAVTKTVAPERIRIAWEAGVRDFGENRVQEAAEKIPLLHDLAPRWHMIGHVQSNKAKPVVDLFAMVQSVDSAEIAERLSRRALVVGRTLSILLEMNVGQEASKFGFDVSPAEWDRTSAAIGSIVALPGLSVQGLMTVAPTATSPEQARPYFRKLRLLRDRLRSLWPQVSWVHLSMGMSDDFEVAIEEGATIVRLGRAIFGPRPVE